MIKYLTENRQELMDLLNSEHEFYLGGSRRMAQKYYERVHIHSDTDYDLYADASYRVEQFLRNAGFATASTSAQYFDDQCVSIWKRDNTQVVLRLDSRFYEKVFESISAEYYVKHLWKSSQIFESHPERRELIGDHFNQMFRSAA